MFASKEVAEEREARAREYRRQAVKSLKIWSLGCIIPAVLFAFLCIYLAGYVTAATRPDCIRPEVTSTR